MDLEPIWRRVPKFFHERGQSFGPLDQLVDLPSVQGLFDHVGQLRARIHHVPIELGQCIRADARVQRFVAYDGDEPVSSGGVNIYPELGFGLLWAGGTVPAARGRGAYSAILAARIACAAARGLRFIGLYARVGTSSPVVAAQGFDSVGRMTYWETSAQWSDAATR